MSAAPRPVPALDELVEWIARRLVPPGTRVDADTLLFQGGLVNSIRVLELIAWTERAIDRTITDPEIRMDNFRTPRRIAEVFFGGNDADDDAAGHAHG